MLQPRKMKHPKWHKEKKKGIETKGTEISFGSYGLKAMQAKRITSRQLEAGRIAIVRTLKRKGKLWIRIFPYQPITTKGSESPMGGGKGRVDHYVFPVRPGRILYELDGVEEDQAREALRKAGNKMPIKCKFVKK